MSKAFNRRLEKLLRRVNDKAEVHVNPDNNEVALFCLKCEHTFAFMPVFDDPSIRPERIILLLRVAIAHVTACDGGCPHSQN